MSDDCKNPSGSLCAILFHFLNLEGIASHRAMWLSWNSPKWEMKHRTHIIGHSFLVMSPFPCLYDFTLPCQIFFSWRSTACNKTEFFLNPQRFSSDNSSAQWWQSQKWISKYANQKTTCTHDQPCQSSSQKFQLWKPTLSAQTLGNCGIGFSDYPTYFKVMSTLWQSWDCQGTLPRCARCSHQGHRYHRTAAPDFLQRLSRPFLLASKSSECFKMPLSRIYCTLSRDFIPLCLLKDSNSCEMMLGLKRPAPECSLHIDRYCLGTQSFPMHICNIPWHSKASENTWPFHFKHVQTKFNLI